MATYNGEKYIQEQLDSFCVQTRLPDELIVSDDGSSDATIHILRSFQDNALFAVQIHENSENQGYTRNFERALSKCSGELVFLSDQDDVWFPEKIEKCIDVLGRHPETQLLIHDLSYCTEDLTEIGQTKIERMEKVFDLDHDFITGMATVVRGSFLALCLPIPDDTSITHDSWLHSCASIIGRKRIVSEVMALYRRHASNATSMNALNVSYTTTIRYFKKGELKRLLFQKTAPLDTDSNKVYEWLEEHKATLLANELTERELIERRFNQEIQRVQAAISRSELLKLNRIRRIVPIVRLMISSGYRFYSGWKSAIKDFMVN